MEKTTNNKKLKALYIATQTIEPSHGICKKILAQVEALRNCGAVVDFCCIKEIDNQYNYVINDRPICKLGSEKVSILASRIKFNSIFQYIINNSIDFVYIRYVHISTPFFIKFLSRLRRNGVKVYMEIPTYPYDLEYKSSKYTVKMLMQIEKYSRKSFEKYIDKIVTVQNYDSIFDIPTIKISNGIDFNSIPVRIPSKHSGYVFLGVANIEEWHGYDRFIEGIGLYYRNNGKKQIHFYIVGDNNNEVLERYKQIVKDYNLVDRVHFEGKKSWPDLIDYFNKADLAVGGLAAHRKGIYEGKALKCVEYASRGIPFVYSDKNMDFDECSFITKASQDDTPIDIEKLISFIDNINISPCEIRKYVQENLTWNIQMKKIIDDFWLN